METAKLSQVVYTAITGGNYDTLKPVPESCREDALFVVFSDSLTRVPEPWMLSPLEWIHDDPRRSARWHKVNSHLLFPWAACTIWHDASHVLKVPPSKLLAYLPDIKTNILATFKHPDRDCIYDEHLACRKLKKDTDVVMSNQIKRYRDQNYPAHHGLLETSVLVRLNCLTNQALNETWSSEISYGSFRDQLSLNYVLWMLQMSAAIIPGCRDRSEFFDYTPHHKK